MHSLNDERDNVVQRAVSHILGQLLLLDAILVQRGHKICQRTGHAELQVQAASGKDKRILQGKQSEVLVSSHPELGNHQSPIQTHLMRDGYEPKQPGGLRRSPLPAGAIRQRNHDRLQLLAANLEVVEGVKSWISLI